MMRQNFVISKDAGRVSQFTITDETFCDVRVAPAQPTAVFQYEFCDAYRIGPVVGNPPAPLGHTLPFLIIIS